ncbi:MAG: phosphoglycerate kinase [Bacteroidia bacterium]|nr:MAG: phosphoglycerate kinase [Bacteroidia bacterium]
MFTDLFIIRAYPCHPYNPCSITIILLTDDTCSGIDAAPQSGFSVTGGGHSAAVVQQLGMDSQLDHVSTGGGACIDFLAGERLPGIEALKEAAVRYMGK